MPDQPPGVACILDTGIVIDFLRGRAYAAELFRQVVREGELAISALSHTEIFAAVEPENEAVTTNVLDGFISIDLTPAIARQAGVLLNQARARGEHADLPAAIIAATALTLDLPVITNDTGRYRFPGLNLIRGQTALRRV